MHPRAVAGGCVAGGDCPIGISLWRHYGWQTEIFFRHLKHTLNMGHWFAQSEAGVQAQLYVALIGYLLSQVVLLWASREARVAPEQYRFTTVVHELAEWLISQLYHNRLLDLQALLDRIRRNAFE